MSSSLTGPGGRVAVVAGLRTPFLKQSTEFRTTTMLELGTMVVRELVQRSELDPKQLSTVIFGQVAPSLSGPNIAREIVLASELPQTIEAFSVIRACATSMQAITSAAEAITLGHSDVVIAGGVDSASDVPVGVSRELARALVAMSKARDLRGRLKALSTLGLRDLLPVPPALREASTGLTMGEAAEKMAKENHISRKDQDEFAHRSHVRAAKAWEDGKFADEVMTAYVPPDFKRSVSEDNNVRHSSSLESYQKLSPVFDRKHGSVTAGNASPLTDGAAAVILMSEKKAKELGYEPLGFIRAFAYAAIDPRGQLLMGPAYAAPKAMARAGLKLKDLDLVDMHEAFAAQVLSNLQAFASKSFADKELGGIEPLGEVDRDKLNVNGGSLAIGHPFAATGARMVTQTLREMKRRGASTALLTICAAGGLGAACVLER